RNDAKPTGTRISIWSSLFVGALAFLLAAFPSRNSDVWLHLAAGRDLAEAFQGAASTTLAPGTTWLYDVTLYAIYSAEGGAAVVAVKALLFAALAVLLLRLSRLESGWLVAVCCTALALLTMSTRLLVQPATVSLLFLTVNLWLVQQHEGTANKR